MLLVKYQPSKHAEIIFSWLMQHNLNPEWTQTLPKLGFVIVGEGEAIAAAFLRRMEGGYALFEGLITNPQCSSSLRHRALIELIPHLLEKAKKLKMKRILAYSRDKSTLERGLSYGFVVQPDVLQVLDL